VDLSPSSLLSAPRRSTGLPYLTVADARDLIGSGGGSSDLKLIDNIPDMWAQ
jgi:hypothetical protein